MTINNATANIFISLLITPRCIALNVINDKNNFNCLEILTAYFPERLGR